jgi:hypothetical protein
MLEAPTGPGKFVELHEATLVCPDGLLTTVVVGVSVRSSLV